MAFSIPEAVRRAIARAIREARGAEVFFAAGVGGDGALRGIRVLARGNADCVPAILRDVEEGEVVIHNHPGGDLTPSDADVAIASAVGNRGVGFLIVDDEALRANAVVEPFRPRPISPVLPEEIDAFFAPGGPLATAFPAYEPRAGQVEMAHEVARAFDEDRIAAIEAGTGIGKSFAYLVPSILWAARNEERVVVSTNTIQLQEQLVEKDLPALERIVSAWGILGGADPPFSFALIKGRSNYICRRRAAEILQAGPSLFDSEEEKNVIEELARWMDVTRDGSLSDLPAPPPPSTWEKVASESDRCLKIECPRYPSCFYYGARRKAQRAHILVVNHHLLFADLAVRAALGGLGQDLVIPGYARVVFDEAHNLEAVASAYFGTAISRRALERQLARLVSPKDPEKGAIPHIAAGLRAFGAERTAAELESEYRDALPGIRARLQEAFDGIWRAIDSAPTGAADGRTAGEGGEERIRFDGREERAAFWGEVIGGLRGIREAILELARRNDRAMGRVREIPTLPDEKLKSWLLDLASTASRLDGALDAIDAFLRDGEPSQVRWVERMRGRSAPNIAFRTAPVLVADALRASIFDEVRSAILTSATLAVEDRFDFIARRIGLDGIDGARIRFRAIPSGFDYARQARLVIPEDLPAPNEEGYEEAIRAWIREALLRTAGRAFILFTSYGLLRRIHDALAPCLRERGIDPMRQGEAPRSRLLERFRRGGHGALFGTDSFWEGVDVRGDALILVVIARLPFRVPTDPLQVARIEEIAARGEDPFATYAVPQAVLRFKQGFGRLIRSRTDRGIVAILDRRVLTKPYGRTFLRSLPPAPVLCAPSEGTLDAISRFLEQ